MPRMLLDAPLVTAEFLAVDTETNGLPGERCELTEVGAVLVGGGELHDGWGSLVSVAQPLGRGIQRFTGISQSMVDTAPAPEDVLPELARRLEGRVLVAHSARFDARVLKQAFARAALTWPEPPVLCTVALARRLAPLQERRGLAVLARALGIDVGEVHRALPDAETCARVFCALFGRLCANAATLGEALALLRPRAKPRRRKEKALSRPDLKGLPKDPGVYIFRNADGHPLYVGKSVCLRTRARAHFAVPTTWTGQAEHVDYQRTESELGALLLEDRLIKALNPPGNVRGKPQDGFVYLRCRLDIPFPILEVAREPASGHAVCIGPVRGRAAASELVEQLNSLFGLRHCGRGLPSRQSPSAYGQMGRCLSPCLGDLDPNLYRSRLDSALALFVGDGDGAEALLAHVSEQIGAASAAREYERAAWLLRRRRRLGSLISRLGGMLRAVHTGARFVLAAHPEDTARADGFWIAGGRVRDWGPVDLAAVARAVVPGDAPGPRNGAGEEAVAMAVAARSLGVLKAAGAASAVGVGATLTPADVAELRLVGAWVAAHDPPTLELRAASDPVQVAAFLRRAAVPRTPSTEIPAHGPDGSTVGVRSGAPA